MFNSDTGFIVSLVMVGVLAIINLVSHPKCSYMRGHYSKRDICGAVAIILVKHGLIAAGIVLLWSL